MMNQMPTNTQRTIKPGLTGSAFYVVFFFARERWEKVGVFEFEEVRVKEEDELERRRRIRVSPGSRMMALFVNEPMVVVFGLLEPKLTIEMLLSNSSSEVRLRFILNRWPLDYSFCLNTYLHG
jgi:hypothetical protein